MALLRIGHIGFCLAILPVGVPSGAQSLNFHVDVSESGQISLVNDSAKPIEAFHLFERCKAWGEPNWFIRDALESPGTTTSDIHGANLRFSQTIGVEPGGRWDVASLPQPQSERADCEGRVDAVIFADGGYEGKAAGVRAVQAFRDGILASLNYWSDTFARENPDGSNLASLLADAKRRQSDSRNGFLKFLPPSGESEPPLAAYWTGRNLVELNIVARLSKKSDSEKASGDYQHIRGFIERWRNKIDGDTSMKKLTSEFPAVSENSDQPGPIGSQH